MIDESFYKEQTAPVLEAIVKFATIPDLYHILNELIKQRKIGIVVRYGTTDLSVLRFEQGREDWLELLIENPQGNQFGELRIRVKGFPPILVYSL